MVKNLPTMQETPVQSLGQENPLEKGKATHSSILTWKIPWTEEPGGLQSMGSQRVRHNWCAPFLSAQSCLTLRNPVDCSLPGSSVQGISQARMLEWVAISSSRGSSPPRNGTCISCTAGGFFTTEPVGKPVALLYPHPVAPSSDPTHS